MIVFDPHRISEPCKNLKTHGKILTLPQILWTHATHATNAKILTHTKIGSWKPLTIIKKRFILDVAANLDTAICFYKDWLFSYKWPTETIMQTMQNLHAFTCSWFKKSIASNIWNRFLKNYAKLVSCRPLACNFIKKESPVQVFSREFNKYLRVPFFVSQFTIGNCKIYDIHLTFKWRVKSMFKNRKNLVSISSLGRQTVQRRKKSRSSRPVVFCKKGVLKNFVKFTGKHLPWSLFFAKLLRTPTLKNICERLLLKIMFIPIQMYNNWHNLLKQFHLPPNNLIYSKNTHKSLDECRRV